MTGRTGRSDRSSFPSHPSAQPTSQRIRNASRLWWYGLLLVPFVGTLWVPFYNSIEPKLEGVPFFYWYQFAWIVISAALTACVYFATGDTGQ
jgi:hypothetical protein